MHVFPGTDALWHGLRHEGGAGSRTWKPEGGAVSVAGGGAAASRASFDPGHTQTRPSASTTGSALTLMP